MNAIEHSVIFDTRFLYSIQELVVAGFRSRHKAVVNESVIMWNGTFGGQDTLEYPQDLGTILQKLRPMTELRLPNLPELDGEEVSELDLAAFNARADVPRSCLRLCISSIPKMRRRCNWILSYPLLDLFHQWLPRNASQSLSRVFISVRVPKKLQRSEVHHLQHDEKSKLLQRHAYDTMIPKSNSLPLNRHLFNLKHLSHNIGQIVRKRSRSAKAAKQPQCSQRSNRAREALPDLQSIVYQSSSSSLLRIRPQNLP